MIPRQRRGVHKTDDSLFILFFYSRVGSLSPQRSRRQLLHPAEASAKMALGASASDPVWPKPLFSRVRRPALVGDPETPEGAGPRLLASSVAVSRLAVLQFVMRRP